MKICIVTRSDLFPPYHGAAARIVNTAKYLSRLGDEVFLLTDDPAAYHVFRGGVRSDESYPSWTSRVGFDVNAAGKRLARLGVPADETFIFLPTLNKNFWVRAAWAARKHRFDVVQAEFPGFAMPASFARNARIPQRPPVVLVEHNVESRRISETHGLDARARRNIERIEKAMFALCDRVVAVSEIDLSTLASAGVPRKKLSIIPHGVDLENYRTLDGAGVRARLRIPDGAFVMVYHGALQYAPNRDAALLLSREIVPELSRRGRDVRLLLAGSNPPAGCRAGDAAGKIIATGAVANLPAHLAAADAAVVPIQSGGGTRMKILEYFAAGLPVVSTPKGAEGTGVVPGRDLVLASSAPAICDALGRLMDDHQHARALGEAGRRFVERYDWLEIARRYQELYKKLRD